MVGELTWIVVCRAVVRNIAGRAEPLPIPCRAGVEQGVNSGAVSAGMLLTGVGDSTIALLVWALLVISLVGAGGWAGAYLSARHGDCRPLLLPPTTLLGFVYGAWLTQTVWGGLLMALFAAYLTLRVAYMVCWNPTVRRQAIQWAVGTVAVSVVVFMMRLM